MRQACRDQQCHCSDDIINLDTEVEELLEEREELLAETKRFRTVIVEALEGRGQFAQSHAFLGSRRVIYWLDLSRAVEPWIPGHIDSTLRGERRGEG